MRVGDFGLGSNAAPSITNFTATLPSGLYSYVENTATGAPGSFQWFGAAIVIRDADGASVLAARRIGNSTAASSARIWHGSRTGTSGPFNFVELLHQGRVLGTVSQSGGVPTGAVIERGSNANGEYVRFADGTQICTRQNFLDADTAAGVEGDGLWTFPAAFGNGTAVVTPSVAALGTGASMIAAARHLRCAAQSGMATNSIIGWRNDGPATLRFRINLTAIGRWF
jgi:hypothetical protein